jgi:hypothetical protein
MVDRVRCASLTGFRANFGSNDTLILTSASTRTRRIIQLPILIEETAGFEIP